MTGWFNNTATFGNYSLTSSGLSDIFVAKMDANGNWLWATGAGGDGIDDGYGIIIDDNGNSFVTGYFEESATFGANTVTGNGGDGVFVASFDSNGNWLWATAGEGTDIVRGRGISTDNTGNCYITGSFTATINFGPFSYISFGSNDIFVAKINVYAPESPAIPTDFEVIPDPGGALEATITWNCPATKINGDPLTDLDEMRIYRDDVLIYTDTAPVIGGPGDYVDYSIPASGFYTYKAVGFNDFGEGTPAIDIYWVGEDVPNVVENLLLINQDGNGLLTWDNPTSGLNGGAYNNSIEGYHLERNDGTVFEITGIQTEYLDTSISSPAFYNYIVTPYNLIGDGGSEISNIEYLGIPFNPPDNLLVDENTGLFTWDTPATDDLNGYNVYLDEVLEGTTTELEWQFTNLIIGTSYIAGVIAVYDEGDSDMVTIEFIFEGTGAGNILLLVTELSGSYPNPFNPTTTINFSFKEVGQVSLEIFNIKGQKVKQLVSEQLLAGQHSVVWDGTDDNNKPVSSGIYFYKLKTENYEKTKRMVLLK